jgi:hypothetical protein
MEWEQRGLARGGGSILVSGSELDSSSRVWSNAPAYDSPILRDFLDDHVAYARDRNSFAR